MFSKVHPTFCSIAFQAVLSCLSEDKAYYFSLDHVNKSHAYLHGMYAWL